MKIFGVLNITSDSFSDGGDFLDTENAIERAALLISEGADVIELSAQSSNPDAEQIDPGLEWERIAPVLHHCLDRGVKVSVDTYRPYVMRRCIEQGVEYINDITSLRDPESAVLLGSGVHPVPEIILMFSHNQGNRAVRKSSLTPENVMDHIYRFFEKKLSEISGTGIPQERIIFDPGMGFFLSSDPSVSIEVLRNLGNLKKYFERIMISVSRKSFIGMLTGGTPPKERLGGTLSCELFSYQQGVDCIRTHDVKQLKQAIILDNLLRGK